MQQPSPSEETQALLARLSQRPGVQSTLILSRDTGAIVRSSGLVTAEEVGEDGAPPTNGTYVNGDSTDGEVKKKGTRNAEEVAALVYNFVKSAGSMVEELNGENDEAKLLRVRTKKNEVVIVPGELCTCPHESHLLINGRRQVPARCNARYTASLRWTLVARAQHHQEIHHMARGAQLMPIRQRHTCRAQSH